MKDNQVELITWSWAGMSWGAKHYYAALRYQGNEEKIRYTLTPQLAKELSFSNYEQYNEAFGVACDKFDTEHEAVEYAKSHWLEYFDGDELVFNDKIIAKKEASNAIPSNA